MATDRQLSFIPNISGRGELVIAETFTRDAKVTLYHGDRLDLLRQIAASGLKAQLIVTSPPYNIGKEYEESAPLPEYVEGQRQTIEACLEIYPGQGASAGR